MYKLENANCCMSLIRTSKAFLTLGCNPFWCAVCSHHQRLTVVFLNMSYNHCLLAENARNGLLANINKTSKSFLRKQCRFPPVWCA